MRGFFLFWLAMAVIALPSVLPAQTATPKKLLVVTTTTGYRHDSIPALEKMLAALAKSSGQFTVDFLDQPLGQPAPLSAHPTEDEIAARQTAEQVWESTTLATALQPLSPAALAGYDGVVFASTTGDLPIPDRAGFLNWIRAGHAFIGIHSASDTFHHWPAYAQMLGGEFDRHGRQVAVDVQVADRTNPATAALPAVWPITQEEIYQFKGYDPTRVHELLYLDRAPGGTGPGHFPLAWCKTYGQGRVFYTALGHREDIINPDPLLAGRINAPAIAQAYDGMILGGIEWALNLPPSGRPLPPP